MKFSEMLIMCGPSSVHCEHSVLDEKTERPLNNHWMKNSKGTIVTRGSAYVSDDYVGSQEEYEGGLEHPHLLVVEGGDIKNYTASKEEILDTTWALSSIKEAQEALGQS